MLPPWAATPEFLTHRNCEIINVGGFKRLHFGIICYAEYKYKDTHTEYSYKGVAGEAGYGMWNGCSRASFPVGRDGRESVF